MKKPTFAAILVTGLFLGGTAIAQDHTVSYTKRNKPVGSTVNVAGEPHTIVKMPLVDIASGDRYSIIFAAPTLFGLSVISSVTTIHSTAQFESNMQIDGYPAFVTVGDGISYAISSNGQGGQQFVVYGNATIGVTIDIGDTLVSLVNSLEMKDNNDMSPLTSADMGMSFNAVPYAQWGRYDDPTDLVNALDKWLDFIRISEL